MRRRGMMMPIATMAGKAAFSCAPWSGNVGIPFPLGILPLAPVGIGERDELI
jgi:hypothetical protein